MSEKARQLYNEGHSAYADGNYELAECKFTEAMALEPSNKDFRLAKGVSLERQGRLDDALREYDRLLELFPDHGTAWTYKAVVFNNRRLYAEGTLCAENALRLNSKDGNAWEQKGLALEMQRKIDEAEECYNELIQLSPAMGWARKGSLLAFEHCDFENALICFDKSLQLDAQNGIAWNGKGAVYSCLGSLEEAINCYENMLKAFPNDACVWNNKGITLTFQGKYQEAEECFRTSYSLDPTYTSPLNSLGYLFLHQGQLQEALKWFEKALVYETEKDFAVQGKALCEYLTTNPRPPTCPDTTGKSLQKFNKLNQTELHFSRGKILMIFGELEEAKKAFEKSLECNPNYKAAAIEISKIKQLRKKKETAGPDNHLQNSALTITTY